MTDVQNLVNMVLGASNIQYLPIDELFNLRNGYTPSKSEPKFWTGGTIPWFVMDDIRQNGTILSDSIQHITPPAVKGNLFPADSIIVSTSATIGSHALIKVPFLCNQRFTCLMLKDKYKGLVDMKYIYYYMDKVDEWCKENTYQSSFQAVDMDGFRNIQVPIPEYDVQLAIIEILDSLSNLYNVLDKQHVCRFDQFNFYLNEVFSKLYSNNELVDIGCVADVCTGSSNKNEASSNGEYPFFVRSENIEKKVEYEFDEEAVIIPGEGGIGDIFHYINGKYALHQRVYRVYLFDKAFDTKFVYYCFKAMFKQYISMNAVVATVSSIRKPMIQLFTIPRIPIVIQRQIASDFDVIQSLLENEKNEIESRHCQFEYYRDVLFSFGGE